MNILQRLNNEMADVVDGVHQALVQIHNGQRGIGAGTIWHEQGLILTNAHVVEGRGRSGHLSVTLFDGREFEARIIESDPTHDIAPLMITADNLPTIEPGDSRGLNAGEWVFAVGHPWGIVNAVTSGIVIGLHPPPELQLPNEDWIAVDLHMRPGFSGGPLVDRHGRLVGINTLITGPNVGYAVPVHVVKKFLKENIGSTVA
ncbi:MAG: S1C family serine protease [Chloroflexi bacterium]|nr:S1C family serine protease [Chloroflexota bacterium]